MSDESNPERESIHERMPNDMICRIMIVLLLGNDALQMGLI